MHTTKVEVDGTSYLASHASMIVLNLNRSPCANSHWEASKLCNDYHYDVMNGGGVKEALNGEST